MGISFPEKIIFILINTGHTLLSGWWRTELSETDPIKICLTENDFFWSIEVCADLVAPETIGHIEADDLFQLEKKQCK